MTVIKAAVFDQLAYGTQTEHGIFPVCYRTEKQAETKAKALRKEGHHVTVKRQGGPFVIFFTELVN